MKLERLIGILAILLQREKVTAPALAELFEVSPRTIRRDVEALCQAGIPLVTTQGAGGGISILEGYRVDRTLLTAPEMQAILAGLRSLDSVSGTRRYAQLMEKLSAGSGTLVPGGAHLLIDLSSWAKTSLPPKIEVIQTALEDHRTLCPQRDLPAGGGTLLFTLPLVGLVCVGLVPDPAGLSPIQTGTNDGPVPWSALFPPARAPSRPGTHPRASRHLHGDHSLPPPVPMAAGGGVRCRQLHPHP